MKISKKIIKATAVNDMYNWICDFKNNGKINKYDKEVQEIYWGYIEKIKQRIFKEL